MLKPFTLFLFVLLSFRGSAQEDSLMRISNFPKADSNKYDESSRHFLWWNKIVYSYNGDKRCATLQRRRFLRNMFIPNTFNRTVNLKSKSWNANGKLITRTTVRPYTMFGKQREIQFGYNEFGKRTSKTITVRELGAVCSKKYKKKEKESQPTS